MTDKRFFESLFYSRFFKVFLRFLDDLIDLETINFFIAFISGFSLALVVFMLHFGFSLYQISQALESINTTYLLFFTLFFRLLFMALDLFVQFISCVLDGDK